MTTLDNARSILQRLASDDAFRAKTEQDPVAAFAEYGFTLDPSIVPGSVNLPSKEEIEANLELLAKQFEASVGWVVFCR